MENQQMTPEEGAEVILGISKDTSIFILTVVTQAGQRHQMVFPSSMVKELHEQLAQIMRRYPGIGAAASPS